MQSNDLGRKKLIIFLNETYNLNQPYSTSNIKMNDSILNQKRKYYHDSIYSCHLLTLYFSHVKAFTYENEFFLDF